MKIYAWILGLFSLLGFMGILFETDPSAESVSGLAYATAVIAFCGLFLYKQREKPKKTSRKAAA